MIRRAGGGIAMGLKHGPEQVRARRRKRARIGHDKAREREREVGAKGALFVIARDGARR